MSLIFKKEFEAGDLLIFDSEPKDLSPRVLKQTHSDKIIFQKDKISPCTEADGICLNLEEMGPEAIAIKTADCLPILFLSSSEVALVHAGWRGIQKGIHLKEELISKSFTQIFIAPSISGENFKVTDEFRDYFPSSAHFSQKQGQLSFNLQKHVIQQLRECYPLAIIESSDICTFEDERFHSYRRNKTINRNWNIFKKRTQNHE